MSNFIARSLDQLEELINQSLKTKDYDKALKSLQQLVYGFIVCPANESFLFNSSQLDELCQKVGKEIYKDENPFDYIPDSQSNVILYIVTELYVTGGHTAVIEDFIRMQPSKKHVILITDINQLGIQEEIKNRFSTLPATLIWAPNISLTDKVIWLIKQVKHYQTTKIFLFNHHFDSVAIAALQPELSSNVIFYHHADHHLCLGVHVDHFLHVDPHPMGFHNCRNKLEIKNNIYWPLSAMDKGKRSIEQTFMKEGKLKTCSSGNSQKFESFYLYRYVEIIPKILRITEGKHLHIGHLSDSALDFIYHELEQLKIPRHHFIYIPWVKSVWETLIQEQIDIYMTSFPIGGIKVSIEVMGSGTPIVAHSNYKSQIVGGEHAIYPERFCWEKPHQLFSYLKALTPEILTEQSKISRAYYEKYHCPKILEEELSKNYGQMEGLEPLVLADFQQDLFQIAFENALRYEKIMGDQHQLRGMLNSTSWRITAPLRALKSFYLKLKQ